MRRSAVWRTSWHPPDCFRPPRLLVAVSDLVSLPLLSPIPDFVVLRAFFGGLHLWSLKNFAGRIVTISECVGETKYSSRQGTGCILEHSSHKSCPFANDLAGVEIFVVLQELGTSGMNPRTRFLWW